MLFVCLFLVMCFKGDTGRLISRWFKICTWVEKDHIKVGVGYWMPPFWGIMLNSDLTLFWWHWSFLSSFMKTLTQSPYRRSIKTDAIGTCHIRDVLCTAKEQLPFARRCHIKAKNIKLLHTCDERYLYSPSFSSVSLFDYTLLFPFRCISEHTLLIVEDRFLSIMSNPHDLGILKMRVCNLTPVALVTWFVWFPWT